MDYMPPAIVFARLGKARIGYIALFVFSLNWGIILHCDKKIYNNYYT
jgi:hypothetical protein